MRAAPRFHGFTFDRSVQNPLTNKNKMSQFGQVKASRDQRMFLSNPEVALGVERTKPTKEQYIGNKENKLLRDTQ